jgi:hypothetical protein
MKRKIDRLFSAARKEISRSTLRRETRPLDSSEIAMLEGNGNSCRDWTRVLTTDRAMLELVSSSGFEGDILLDIRSGGFSTLLGSRQSLIENVRLRNVEITGRACLSGVQLIEGYRIHDCVLIESSGTISYRPGTPCGSGTSLELGIETGERSVRSFPCLDVELAAAMSDGTTRRELEDVYNSSLDRFLASVRGRHSGDICRDVVIRATPLIEDSWLGRSARIENCLAVRNSTVLGGKDAGARLTDGCLVRNSIIKWHSCVDSMAVVTDSVVGECAVVERHGKLTSSFLGPDSVLGGGEMTACLAGPLTSMHHQSLLIAARWPEGKGNIGYGANVGSNHTSRMPDQEIVCGEGTFFGLGCSIKFPADLSCAPYSILATGVTTLPQKLLFPFSLIGAPMERPEGVPEAWNQLIPAWVLSDNLYALVRSKQKVVERRKASHSECESEIFRSDTVRLMLAARKQLASVTGQEFYTECEITGAGKNFISDAHRTAGIETYGRFIRFWALLMLLKMYESVEGAIPSNKLPDVSDDSEWAFVAEILECEYKDVSVKEMFGMLPYLIEAQLESVVVSREKDESRGNRIISDYGLVHEPAGNDPVVKYMENIREDIVSRTHNVLGRLQDTSLREY